MTEEAMRKDFEAAAPSLGLTDLCRNGSLGGLARTYWDGCTEAAWLAWQAATRAAAPAWLPIESAPKDGSKMLLSNGLTVSEGEWLHAEPYIREHRDLDGRYVGQDESDGFDGWMDYDGGMLPEPTLYMPLPPVPEAKP